MKSSGSSSNCVSNHTNKRCANHVCLAFITLAIQLLIVFAVKDSLDETDMDNLKMFALRLDANISRSCTNKFRRAYRNKINLDTFYLMHQRMAILADIKPEIYDCCVNTCYAFIGEFAALGRCPFCSEGRHDTENRPCLCYEYIPIIPRLKGYYMSPQMVNMLSYRANRTCTPGEYSDIFDGSHYQNLVNAKLVVEGIEYDTNFFSDARDIALGLLSDG
ncbi:hypothetical protein K439DRAFT_1354937, partial [Ramaria rubella]